MGYPKKHRGRRKIGSKKRRARRRNKKRQSEQIMESIAQIKKLSLWIFIIPFVAINLCLFISVNYQIFDNTFLSVDHIGRTNPTFPYFDGGVSISRTARTYPAYLVFKPSMIFTSILLILYWIKTMNHQHNTKNFMKKVNYNLLI